MLPKLIIVIILLIDINIWITFDGPIDPNWIENMNSALDDNKSLILPNGQKIKLENNLRLVFEVENLDQASPATISRCGMVYVDPQELGWFVLIKK